jgi:hypothetical protein
MDTLVLPLNCFRVLNPPSATLESLAVQLQLECGQPAKMGLENRHNAVYEGFSSTLLKIKRVTYFIALLLVKFTSQET